MVGFDVTTTAPVPVTRAWAVLTDWTAHGSWVPLTRVVLTDRSDPVAAPGGLGQEFVATTRLGPFRLVDRMVVTGWTPPTAVAPSGRCTVRKLGPHLHGGAEIEVTPLGDGTTRVAWHEEVRPASSLLAWPARLANPVTRPLSRRLFRRVLAKAVREMEQRSAADRPDPAEEP